MTPGMWPVKCQPLRWYGGKAGYGKAEWIASLLPWKKDSTYVEPFGGMAGVLLRRAPVKCEIFNDLDFLVWNWWKTVRDYREDFAMMVESTPLSETDHKWACEIMNDKGASGIDRALAFHIAADQSFCNELQTPHFRVGFGSPNRRSWTSERIVMLADRMWNVQLLCRSAESILERVVDLDSAVIYADPPYPSADTRAYSVCEVDVDALTRLFRAQQGKVAVSGYLGEWDHLGWQRHERAATMMAAKEGEGRGRTEVLWTNYDVGDVRNMHGSLFAQAN